MQCPYCVAVNPDEDLFCEECGKRMSDEPAVKLRCTCGAEDAEVDEEGFCTACGRRVIRPASDHIELEISVDFAGVSDRGLRHSRNEDRFAIQAVNGGYALIVCDGVSSSPDADAAAAQVAEHTLQTLAELASTEAVDPEQALRGAVMAASSELAKSAKAGGESPSTTAVAALVSGEQVTIAWIGDSRAYWIAGGQARQLTADHSWLNAVLSSGELTREAAEGSPNAHALIRWLGADAAGDGKPDIVQHPWTNDRAKPGLLLLCSDGLWNYAAEEKQMADLVEQVSVEEANAVDIARSLVDYARSRGGHDNITAVVLRNTLAPEEEVNAQ